MRKIETLMRKNKEKHNKKIETSMIKNKEKHNKKLNLDRQDVKTLSENHWTPVR